LVSLVQAAQPGMTGVEAEAVIAAVRASRRVDSLTAWAGSPRGQVDIRERLAAHRLTQAGAVDSRPACPYGCRDGWLGEDDAGRVIPCPHCKPHRASGHG
jgi:hypothetical protein